MPLATPISHGDDEIGLALGCAELPESRSLKSWKVYTITLVNVSTKVQDFSFSLLFPQELNTLIFHIQHFRPQDDTSLPHSQSFHHSLFPLSIASQQNTTMHLPFPASHLLTLLPLLTLISAQYQPYHHTLSTRDADYADAISYLSARDLNTLHRRCTEADRSPVTGELPAGCQVAEYNPTVDAPLRKRPRPVAAGRKAVPARAPVKVAADSPAGGRKARRGLEEF